jgi:hypothetical protein
MSKNESKGTGKKPMPAPRTKMKEDYTPKPAPRKSQRDNLDYKMPAPSSSHTQGKTHEWCQPAGSSSSKYDSKSNKSYGSDPDSNMSSINSSSTRGECVIS